MDQKEIKTTNLKNNKKRILLVHNFYKYRGGEDMVFFREMQMLKDHGYEVYTYTRKNSELTKTWKKCLLPLVTLWNPRTFFAVIRLVKKHNIDVIHVHNARVFISPAVYSAGFFTHTKIVQTLHNFRLQCPGGMFYRNGQVCEDCIKSGLKCSVKHSCYRDSKYGTLGLAISNWLCRKFGVYRRIHFICLSDFNKSKLLQENRDGRIVVDPRKVFVKPNFTTEKNMYSLDQMVDSGVLLSEKNKMRELEKQAENGYYLYAGRIEKEKGIVPLIKAFEKNKKTLFVAGEGSLKKKLEDHVDKKGLDNIQILGYIENDVLKDVVAHAKALIVPSLWYETFGLVVIEAYSKGIPVLVSDTGNLKELVRNGETGFTFRTGSSRALCESIEKLEASNGEMLGKKAFALYERFYKEEENFRLLSKIYASME